jgi:hypothetical protein
MIRFKDLKSLCAHCVHIPKLLHSAGTNEACSVFICTKGQAETVQSQMEQQQAKEN